MKTNLWSAREDEILRELSATTDPKEIVRLLDRTLNAVRNRRAFLRIPGRRVGTNTKYPLWSEEQEQFLRENYMNLSYREIGELFNISSGAVSRKVKRLGLQPKLKQDWHPTGQDSPLWKGGSNNNRYGFLWWRVTKWKVFERDNWMCLLCGLFSPSGIFLKAHHIDPWLETHDNSMENHATLCDPCHRKVHASIDRELIRSIVMNNDATAYMDVKQAASAISGLLDED